MARASKSSYLELCRDRIAKSAKWRKENYEPTWHKMRDYYRGKQVPDMDSDDYAVVNMMFATANVILPSVAVNNPRITVNPTSEAAVDRVQIIEAVANYRWRKHNYRAEMRRGTKDSIIYGHGWLKQGWRTSTAYVERDVNEVADDLVAVANEFDAAAEAVPALAGVMPSDEEMIPQETAERVETSYPFCERVSPFDVFIDPAATCMDDMRWIAQRIWRTVAEVKQDQRYRPASRSKVKVGGYMNGTDSHDDVRRQDRDGAFAEQDGWVCVYEFYDIIKGTLAIFAREGDGGFLVDPRPIPFPFGHPFSLIPNYEVPDDFYCMGDLEQLKCLQDELNLTRSEQFRNRRGSVPKWLTKKGVLGADAKKALASRTAGAVIEVEGNEPLSEAAVPLQQQSYNPESYNQSEMIQQDMANVSAVNEYQSGTAPNIRRTATEAAMIQDAANARAADKLAQVESAITVVARRTIQLCETFMTGEEVARIMGPNSDPQFFTYTADDLAGEWDYEVEAGSTQPNNESFRRQAALQLVDAMAPFASTPGLLKMDELAKHVLTSFGIKDPNRFIDEQAFMQQQQMQMMGGPPPGDMGPGGAAPPTDGPPPPPQDPQGGSDAIPEGILNQLSGQSGFAPQNMGAGLVH